MDTLTRLPEHAAPAGSPPPPWPSLPPEAPLEMPVQSFADAPARNGAGAAIPDGAMTMRRLALFVATALLTGFAAREMFLVLQVAGLTLLERFVLGLFVILFAWVAFSFITNFAGFLATLAGVGRLRGIDETSPLPSFSSRTALLFPVYNEEAARVMARLQAMHESLAEAGALGSFDFFVLSDTTNPDIWITEEAAFLKVRDALGAHEKLFYRHRRRNQGRKAGNIGDWVTRFGGGYDYMVVLDADSLMTGETLVRLARLMELRPYTGLSRPCRSSSTAQRCSPGCSSSPTASTGRCSALDSPGGTVPTATTGGTTPSSAPGLSPSRPAFRNFPVANRSAGKS